LFKNKYYPMKKHFLRWSNYAMSMALFASVILISACDNDDELTAPPSVDIAPTTSQGLPGTEVNAEVTIDALGGLSELIVLKNGAAFNTEAFNGEKEATYDFSYIIEDLPIGTIVNFTFQALDNQDRYSNLATIAVTVSSKTLVEIGTVGASTVISTNTTWTADKIYLLKGFVRVGDDAKRSGGTNVTGVTLTIEPGTIIMGDRESKGALIIQRGNKIMAEGTAESPIVFTSERAPGVRQPGDWSGLVIVGRAVNNQGANVELEGAYGAFHGVGDAPIASPDEDNSGSLKYVRIEFAGNPINPNQEVNSLTMGSVGSGTTLDYVQASYGLDDSFEWFGGKVNAKHLIAYRGLDDDFDVDFGYSGNVQWAIGIRDNTLADQSGSNGFEVDNDASGTAATPFTSPVFSNVTLIGPKKSRDLNIQDNFQNAMHIRRNNKIRIYNSFLTGYPNGLFIDGSTTRANAYGTDGTDGSLQLRNVYLAGVDNWGGSGYGEAGTVFGTAPANGVQHPQAPRGFAVRDKDTQTVPADIFMDAGNTIKPSAWFGTAAFGNKLVTKWQDCGVNETIFDLGASPILLPSGGSESLLNKTSLWDASVTPASGAFFDKTVNYIGAFGATNWTSGWASFTATTNVYQ
jgi:hypothetical protein